MKPSACECKCKFPRLLRQMRYIWQNPAKTVILVVLLSVALDIWVLVYECFRNALQNPVASKLDKLFQPIISSR